jgi:hypothetical protein
MNTMVFKWGVMFCGALIICFIFTGFNGPEQNSSNSEILKNVQLSSNSNFNIGQKSSDGTLDFTLNDIQFPGYVIKGLTSADKGYQYLIANVTITNSGNSAVQFNSLFHVFVIDDKKSIYNVDQFRSGYIQNGWHDEDIGPGKSIKGLMVFEVPADSSSFELDFYFIPSDFSQAAVYKFANQYSTH